MSEIKKIEKPWGYEIWWASTDKYAGKFLHINPDAVTWAEVRRVGNDAEGWLMAKAGHSENNMCVNMVTADCEDRNNSQKRNGDPDIRCYRCNGKGHRL